MNGPDDKDPRSDPTKNEKSSVLVLGCGRMGSAIAVEFALSGHQTIVVSRDCSRANLAVENAVEQACTFGRMTKDEVIEVLSRLLVVDPVSQSGLETVPDLILDCLPESKDLKAQVIGPLARRFPRAIIATNTSSLSITELGNEIGASERVIGTHYLNPVLAFDLVEVIPGEATSASVEREVVSILEMLGRKPIAVKADVPGFVWNRLQFALLREALWLVEEGVCDPESIDRTVTEGLAPRWMTQGPFGTAALGGKETFRQIAENLFPELSRSESPEGLNSAVSRLSGDLDQRAAERDLKLFRLLREGGLIQRDTTEDENGERPIRRLDHVAILVRDTDRALHAFTGGLGLKVAHDEKISSPPARLTYIDCGNAFLQLVQPLDPDGPLSAALDQNGEGLHHICFGVDEVVTAATVLTGSPPASLGSGRGRQSAFLAEDYAGTRVELTGFEYQADVEASRGCLGD